MDCNEEEESGHHAESDNWRRSPVCSTGGADRGGGVTVLQNAVAMAEEPQEQQFRPLFLMFLLDCSFSMSKIDAGQRSSRLHQAMVEMISIVDSLRPQDFVRVIGFNDRIMDMVQYCDPAKAADALRKLLAIAGNVARASTRLYDAIDFAIDQLVLRKEDQKEIVKGLVILSDGGDNGSRICGDTVMMRVKKPGFPLFNVVSLGIFAKDEELDFLKSMATLMPHVTYISGEEQRVHSTFQVLANKVARMMSVKLHKNSKGTCSSENPLPTPTGPRYHLEDFVGLSTTPQDPDLQAGLPTPTPSDSCPMQQKRNLSPKTVKKQRLRCRVVAGHKSTEEEMDTVCLEEPGHNPRARKGQDFPRRRSPRLPSSHSSNSSTPTSEREPQQKCQVSPRRGGGRAPFHSRCWGKKEGPGGNNFKNNEKDDCGIAEEKKESQKKGRQTKISTSLQAKDHHSHSNSSRSKSDGASSSCALPPPARSDSLADQPTTDSSATCFVISIVIFFFLACWTAFMR